MTTANNRAHHKTEKRQRILTAALDVFASDGFSGASMDNIAIAAQVSKPTLYIYFGSKELLFEAIMMAGRKEMLSAFEHPSGHLVKDLHAFAWHYADIVMQPAYLSLARLIIGEAQRFPAIGAAYQKAGPDRVLEGMMDYLKLAKAKKQLQFSDAELAAQDLWALILSAPRNKALHIPDHLPDQKELKRYIYNGLKIFLTAYSSNAANDIAELTKIIKTKPRTA